MFSGDLFLLPPTITITILAPRLALAPRLRTDLRQNRVVHQGDHLVLVLDLTPAPAPTLALAMAPWAPWALAPANPVKSLSSLGAPLPVLSSAL